MFAGQGRLSGVVCPLNAVGQCNRPYCHFKHSSSSSAAADNGLRSRTSPSAAARNSSSTELLISTAAAAGGGVSDGENVLAGTESSRSPSPTSGFQPPKRPSLAPPRSHIPAIRMPQYKPTPLAVLQRRQQHTPAAVAAAVAVADAAIAAESTRNLMPLEPGGTTSTLPEIERGNSSDVPAVGSAAAAAAATAAAASMPVDEDQDDPDDVTARDNSFGPEDIDDEEEAILREIFHKGIKEEESLPSKESAEARVSAGTDAKHLTTNAAGDQDTQIKTEQWKVSGLESDNDFKKKTLDDQTNKSIARPRDKDREREKDREHTKDRSRASSHKKSTSSTSSSTTTTSSRPQSKSERSSSNSSSRKHHSSERSVEKASSNGHHKDRKEDHHKDRNHRNKEKHSTSKHREGKHGHHKDSKTDGDKKCKHDSASSSSSSSKKKSLSPAVSSSKEKSSSSPSSSLPTQQKSKSETLKTVDANSSASKRNGDDRNRNGNHSENSTGSSSSSRRENKHKSKTSSSAVDIQNGSDHQSSTESSKSDDSGRGEDSSRKPSSSAGRRTESTKQERKRPESPEVIDVDEVYIDDVELSDEDPEQECLRLFQECENNMMMAKNDPATDLPPPQASTSEPSKVFDMVGTTRKRIAHDPGDRVVAPSAPLIKKPFRPSPAQQLAMRHQALQRARQQRPNLPGEAPPLATPIVHPIPSDQQRRQRISTVPTGLVQAVLQRKSIAPGSVSATARPCPNLPSTSASTSASAGSSHSSKALDRLLPLSPGPPPIKRVANTVRLPHATNHVQQKGVSRVAHTVKEIRPSGDPVAPPRPRIAYDPHSRIPINVRQNYLGILIEQNNLICTTYEESYEKSLNEERDLCSRSSNQQVYISLVANLLIRLRKASSESGRTANSSSSNNNNNNNTTNNSPGAPGTLLHAVILDGPKAIRTSYSIERRRFRSNVSVENITEEQLYHHLRDRYLMKPSELDQMGYPRPCEGKSVGRVEFRSETALASGPDPRLGNERTCSRCRKTYLVDRDGMYIRKEHCVYHWGKNWARKVKRGNTRESQYTCCDAESGSDGCCVANGHVFENPPLKEDDHYVTTLPAEPSAADIYKRVYAIDCEMIYTTRGTELARVSMVDMKLQTVYETKVKPQNPVLDYNTRFSGLKMEDLETVTTELHEVQAAILARVSTDTILIGHSLESDLKALKIVHSTVVDTSLVFPHKLGLPYKRALKNLLKDHCQKIIQDGVDGHDSAEDAKACMELMLYKVKQDLRSE